MTDRRSERPEGAPIGSRSSTKLVWWALRAVEFRPPGPPPAASAAPTRPHTAGRRPPPANLAHTAVKFAPRPHHRSLAPLPERLVIGWETCMSGIGPRAGLLALAIASVSVTPYRLRPPDGWIRSNSRSALCSQELQQLKREAAKRKTEAAAAQTEVARAREEAAQARAEAQAAQRRLDAAAPATTLPENDYKVIFPNSRPTIGTADGRIQAPWHAISVRQLGRACCGSSCRATTCDVARKTTPSTSSRWRRAHSSRSDVRHVI